MGQLENKKLHEGLALDDNPNHFVIFKDSSSGMEFIRTSREIMDKGLYFTLNAYECHVLMDFRDVHENELGQYGQLTAYLGGRGVPSIDQALKELMLAPILNPLRALINVENMRAIYLSRLSNPDEKLDKDVLSTHAESYQHFLVAIKDFINVTTDIGPILREEQRGIEAILKLPYFEQRYPFPGSKHYKKILNYILENLGDYPFIWYVLTMWNDLRLIGRLITSKSQYAEISRSWLDEWGISRIAQQTFEELGLEAQQAQSGLNIIKLLVEQQNWIDDVDRKTPLSIMEDWLSEEDIRTFLNINRYRGKLWFNKESFESMMWWMMTIALIQLISDPEKSLTEVVETLFDAYEKIEVILEAQKDSAYQLEKLLEGLK